MNLPTPQILDNSEILKSYHDNFSNSLIDNGLTEEQVESGFMDILHNPKINSDEGIEKISDYINSLQDSLGEDPFPVYHKFGGGMYTREIHMPKGYAVVGKKHKHESMVYMLKGKVIVADKEGTKVVEAPVQFVSKGGIKRVGYVVEDVVWIDIHSTKETTITAAELDIFEIEAYSDMAKSLGVTEKEITNMSENENDMIEIDNDLIAVKDSNIDKKGIFSMESIEKNEMVGASRIGLLRTDLGRYTNHSFNANVKCEVDNNAIYFIASKEIEGNEEITVDYKEAVSASKLLNSTLYNYMKGGLLCQV